ncbi:MAG: radical SAM protein [Syntrophomonadaceae bacterium]|nr:radical SAM protein [Syntrophomonadaceae bacterium]
MSDRENALQKAWEVRQNFDPSIWFAAPGAKHYETRYYANQANSFVNLSITGEACACRCDHCDGKLLHSMIGAPTPGEMRRVVDQLLDQGCRGILVSGGADSRGQVPLLPFVDAIAYASQSGLKVLVHSGLIDRATAANLSEADVDQVLIDIIGDQDTIRQVYHLDRHPDDYLQAMLCCREFDLNIAPHVVIGLHYGKIRGEKRALEMIAQADPETVILVILTPACGTPMAIIEPPAIEEAAEIIAAARLTNPYVPLSLGCARPPGQYKRKIEIQAVDCGVNSIAYPDEATVAYAQSKGLQTKFTEECCSLIARSVKRGNCRAYDN